MSVGGYRFHPQDAAAALVAIILAMGVVVLAVLDHDIPPEIAGPLGASTTWLFVRSVQVGSNGHA